MSGQHADSRRETAASSGNTTDVFITRFANPHTAIPDWLIFTKALKPDVRHMATVIILMAKNPLPPTKAEIARVCGVTERTIQRWLAQLKSDGFMSYQAVGKRRLYVFHEPPTISDPRDTDPRDTDPHVSEDTTINDRSVIDPQNGIQGDHGFATNYNVRSFRQRISDRSGGGGSHDSPTIQKLPTTSAPKPQKVHPSMIQSETARWLVKVGFNIASAYRFRDLPLQVAQADYSRRRKLGQGNGAIINAWTVELPEFDQSNDQAAGPIPEDRRAELRAKYGDLFLFSGDAVDIAGEDE